MNKFLILIIFFLISLSFSYAESVQLYGISSGNLVKIDHNDPSNIRIVGALGITPSVYHLTYHAGINKLVGIARDSAHVTTLYEINQQNGDATLLANLGDADSVGYYESFSYVDTLNKIVVSRGSTSSLYGSSNFYTVDLDGTLTHLMNNGLDNDLGIYDSNHDIFFTADSNSHGCLMNVNLTTGANTNLGTLDTYGTMAFNPDNSYIYVSSGSLLKYISTSDGQAPISTGTIGTFAYSVGAIAFAPVPEPATILLFSVLIFIVAFKKKHS